MTVKGLQKLTLLDFPGRLATTVFLGGCNLRCPFCHNASLVLSGGSEDISEEELFKFLEGRRGKLSGVCITGGEPTLYKELPTFINNIRSLGFAVKLDTNGTDPEMLRSLVADGLVDYIAMDIKNSKHKYAVTAGISSLDISGIEKSVEFLLSGDIEYEFRTTVVRELHSREDITAIGEWIKGAKRYFLQSFKDSGDIIGRGLSSYSEAEISDLLKLVKINVPNAQIRG